MSRVSIPSIVLLFVAILFFIGWISRSNDLSHYYAYKDRINDGQANIIIYNRIPKTGSTTFTNAIAYDLCHINGFHAIHINVTKNAFMLNVKDQIHFAKNVSEWTEMRPAFYHGHLAFVNFERLGFPAPIYINIVREPLDRFISYYYFLRFGDDYRVGLKRSKAGNNQTFEECVKKRGRDCDPNKMWVQIPYFCGSAKFCRDVGNPTALATAKRNLIDHYLTVGYTTRIRDLIRMLEHLMPSFFRTALTHYDSLGAKAHLRSTITKFPTPDNILEIMRNSTAYRMEKDFYDFAVSTFDAAFEDWVDKNGDPLPVQYHYEKIRE